MQSEVRCFEVRDQGTHIPVMAIRFTADAGESDYPLRRAGYLRGVPYVLLIHLGTGRSNYDPFAWPNRTMRVAHDAIGAKWDTLGLVVDVEYELGLTSAPKVSEQFTGSRLPLPIDSIEADSYAMDFRKPDHPPLASPDADPLPAAGRNGGGTITA